MLEIVKVNIYENFIETTLMYTEKKVEILMNHCHPQTDEIKKSFQRIARFSPSQTQEIEIIPL